jgi:ribosomal protein S13
MKPATISQLKKELETYTQQRLVEVVLAAAKYKTENKELLSFILFDSDNISGYVEDIKLEIDQDIANVLDMSLYRAIKALRKTLRLVAKYCKFVGDKQVEATLYLHFCETMVENGLMIHRFKAIHALYTRQLDRVEKLIPKLHEDLQVDYTDKIENLSRYIKHF